jgi:hypothetical protein
LTLLLSVIRDLGLAMGIIDAKLADDVTLVFLEVNPHRGADQRPLATTMAALLINPP